MERDEPKEEEESLRALLLPSPTDSSLGLLVRFPLSSARTAITCRGSVLLPSLMPISSPLLIAFDLSELLENLLKGLNGSEGAMRSVTGLLPRPLECSRGGECLDRRTRGRLPTLLYWGFSCLARTMLVNRVVNPGL